jgi:hypothetical protein
MRSLSHKSSTWVRPLIRKSVPRGWRRLLARPPVSWKDKLISRDLFCGRAVNRPLFFNWRRVHLSLTYLDAA